MAAWKATLRWHGAWRAGVGTFVSTTVHRVAGNGRGGGMEQAEGGARRAGPGGTRTDLGVRPTKTTLLRQGQAGIAVQHMKMALFDEGGVGGGQDIDRKSVVQGKRVDLGG